MQVPAGTTYGTWEIVREVDRRKTNRRFDCRCTGCGGTTTKWLSNLLQGKTTCLTCKPWSTIHRATLASIATKRRATAQETDDGRRCHTCQTWKTWNNFRPDPRRPRGKSSNCIECGRWRRIKAMYGISRSDWESVLAGQNGTCALCDDPENLMVDHDHACCGEGHGCRGCIRGLLCDFCNRVLGRIEQKPTLAARFSAYLAGRPLLQ